MTQQNETQQQDAAAEGPPGQRIPARPELTSPEQQGTSAQPGAPSAVAPPPSLYGYESLPEAYLAPPQPGQPSYGALPHPGGGRAYGGRTGYTQPGSGQPASGQPGYGRSAPVRPGLGFATRRDPALAPVWQRFAAQTIDWTIIFLVSAIVLWSQLSVVVHEVQAFMLRYPDHASPAADAALTRILSSASYQHAATYWFLGMFGIALAYYWVQHAAWGATVGKLALGMRVVRADRSRLGVLGAGIRAVAFLAGPAILFFGYPLNFVGAILWAADAGLPLLDSRAQSLHDKLAGTIVVRQRALDDRARRSASW